MSVWTKHPLPRLMGATATWHALEMVTSVVVGNGPWTSTRTLPTTPPTSLILDASRTPSMILTGCSLRDPTIISGTIHLNGKLILINYISIFCFLTDIFYFSGVWLTAPLEVMIMLVYSMAPSAFAPIPALREPVMRAGAIMDVPETAQSKCVEVLVTSTSSTPTHTKPRLTTGAVGTLLKTPTTKNGTTT